MAMFNILRQLILAFLLAFSVMLPVQAEAGVPEQQTVSVESWPVVTITGTIQSLPGYDSDGEHQYALISNVRRVSGSVSVPSTIFASIRIDERGTDGVLPLRVGSSIQIKGEFIPEDEAYKTPENCCYAVIHFTHDPVGYVYYNGVYYR
jgi:hypothetical protein